MNSVHTEDLLKHDETITLINRDRLQQNTNLLLWYRKLYECQFRNVEDITEKAILEIGSGTSPLKLFYKNVITSDILDLHYTDYTFDCHNIDSFEPIPDDSIDIITLTNVLHHLKEPLIFLIKAGTKLKNGGQIILTEPFFSVFSYVIWKYLHHEPSIFDISLPVLDEVKGPLSSANMSIPYLVFFKRADWNRALSDVFTFSTNNAVYFSAFSYMMTGGISRSLLIPHFLYKAFLHFDLWLARAFPKIFGSFFIMKLIKK
ncbi:MAG: methyltransferase domain-containing protein [Nitrospirae bacterium]|nr:MAG: methyltransferase domain-containing protein [Nitrospirota bacterium]